MEITDVRSTRSARRRWKAYASVIFDECFIIRDSR